jgi:hypothetical protein
MGFMGGGVVWGQDVPATDWDCKSQPRGSWAVDEFVEVEERGADHGVGDCFAAGPLEVAGECGC